MPNILDLYHLDTTTASGQFQVREIIKEHTTSTLLIDYIMGVINDNANLLKDVAERDEDTECQMCSEIEEENVRLEKEVARRERELAA